MIPQQVKDISNYIWDFITTHKKTTAFVVVVIGLALIIKVF